MTEGQPILQPPIIHGPVHYYYFEVGPVPSNNAYSTSIRFGRPRRFLLPKYAKWKEDIKARAAAQDYFRGLNFSVNDFLNVVIYLGWPEDGFYYKSTGDVQRKDLSGHIKLLEDALAEYWDVDDKYTIHLRMHKVVTPRPCILVAVAPLMSTEQLCLSAVLPNCT